ncbi:hypothetical protein ANN_17281 [Periplaneta americana]|uniref:Mariner Mos1 transposase n=1 Tax=Periplaneta americana TaxID=6978 RepID=A0ABQ8STS7_PERAM|nr:hypothetical protein ANN_17281 [Periplaneta americana]
MQYSLTVLETYSSTARMASDRFEDKRALRIRDAVWDCDWVGTPVSFQRSLAIMIACANQEVVMTAGKIVPISKQTIMNASLTIYLICDRTRALLIRSSNFVNITDVATLKKLQARLNRVRRHREKQDVLLVHDNAQPYVSHKTTHQIRKFGKTTLKHPPYSPELPPCDYHLFGKLKDPFSERVTQKKNDTILGRRKLKFYSAVHSIST